MVRNSYAGDLVEGGGMLGGVNMVAIEGLVQNQSQQGYRGGHKDGFSKGMDQ